MRPEDVQALFDKANDLLDAGKAAETLRCLEGVEDQLTDDDDRIELGALQSWALSELGRHREALERIEPMIEEFDDSPRLLSTLGVVLSNSGRLIEACEALERALELDEDDESTVANLGLVYEKLYEYERALGLYDQAIEKGGQIDWLLRRKAAVLTELNRPTEAITALRRYLSLAPDDEAQWIDLAILYSDQDDFDSAGQCFREAERIAPDSPGLRLNWGVTAVRAKDLRLAQLQLAYLERLEPDGARPRLLRAYILEEQSQDQEAWAQYSDALSRARGEEGDELAYALEMAMDFAARHEMAADCRRLFREAYAANCCSMEFCEPYRELFGEPLEKGVWYSITVEADYRGGLNEVTDGGDPEGATPTRFLRAYQIVARDRDDALTLLRETLEELGETNLVIREFLNEEPLENTHTGVYEIEPDALVFAEDSR